MRLTVFAFLTLLPTGCEDAPRQADHPPDFISPKAANRSRYLVNSPRPPARLIEEIEQEISLDPCVRSLDRWERLYTFALDEQQKVDEDKIVIHFRQAGVHGFKAGRRIGYPLEGVNVDDRQYELVWGSYDRRTGKLSIKFCGPNVPQT